MIEAIKIVTKTLVLKNSFLQLFVRGNEKYDINSKNSCLLKEIDDAYNSGAKILWYPSSGTDIQDIEYVDQQHLGEIDSEPTIFIHTDPWALDGNIAGLNGAEMFEGISFIDKSTLFYKLNIVTKTKYLILIKICNEDFFAEIIKDKYKIAVEFIYNFCDGITTGMGGGLCRRRITTLFYTQFYKSLQVKYHITEYGIQYIHRYPEFTDAINEYLGEHLDNDNNPYIENRIDERFPISIQNKPFVEINHREGLLRFCQEVP